MGSTKLAVVYGAVPCCKDVVYVLGALVSYRNEVELFLSGASAATNCGHWRCLSLTSRGSIKRKQNNINILFRPSDQGNMICFFFNRHAFECIIIWYALLNQGNELMAFEKWNTNAIPMSNLVNYICFNI